MSPLRLTNRRPGNVGAPLVTPVDGLIRPPTIGTPANGLAEQTAAVPHIPACHPGDMNVAPTIDKPPPGKRRDATCDARRRFGTPADDWHARRRLAEQTAAVLHIPACHPGDMNVAPTIDKPPPGKRRGATCDARRPIDGTKPPPGKRRGATCDARRPIGTPADGLARPSTVWHARRWIGGTARPNCRAEVSRKTICALLFVRSVTAHGAKLRRFRALLISQKALNVSLKAQIFLHDTDNRNNFAVWQRRKNWKSYIPHGSN